MRISRNYFTGASKLFGPAGLGDALVALAIDNARARLLVDLGAGASATVKAITDNTTGVNGGKIVDLVLPAKFNAATAGGVSTTALNTALGKVQNAQAVLAQSLTRPRGLIGLSAINKDAGTVATADTVPAQDKTITGQTGSNSVKFASASAALIMARDNQRKLVDAYNDTLAAIGVAPMAGVMSGNAASMDTTVTMEAIPTVTSSTDGKDSMSKAAVDAFMGAMAANFASLIAHWNANVPTQTARALHLIAR